MFLGFILVCLFSQTVCFQLGKFSFFRNVQKASAALTQRSMMDANVEGQKTKSEIDLWVVGAGVLGEEVARKFQKNFPVSAIVCETSRTRKHERFKASGFVAKLRDQRSTDDFGIARNLVISIPPSSSNDYVSEVRDALQLWAGPSGGGSVVFTSSVGVYGEADGITVNEESPVDRVSPRSSLLVEAEDVVLAKNGNVVRLAGLYHATRGPHVYWLQMAKEGRQIQSNKDGLVNLVHYEDAAVAVLAALTSDARSSVFIASDGHPIRKDEIVSATLTSPLFKDSVVPQFARETGPQGKICDNRKSRELLRWQPRFPSFAEFMRDHSTDPTSLTTAGGKHSP